MLEEFYIPNGYKWVKKSSLNDLKDPSYHTRVVINDSYCDIFITVSCNNIDFLVTAMILNDAIMTPVKSEQNFEMNTRCFIFSCPNERLTRNGQLIDKNVFLNFKLIAHFNSVEFKIMLTQEETEKGLTFREEKISSITNDLLYIYGVFYIYILKKLGDELAGELNKRCNQLIDLFGELDQIWELDGKPNEYLKEENFIESLLQMYFIDITKSKGSSDLYSKLINNNFKNQLNLPTSYMNLKDCVSNSKSSKELFEKILPTVNQLSKLQGQTLEIRELNTTEKLCVAGGLMLIPLSFIPGLNLVAAQACAAVGAGPSLFGLYRVVNLYRYSMRQYQGYLTILEILMKAFEIKKESCLPYFCAYEKAIYIEYEKRGFFKKSIDDFIKDWDNIFAKSEYIPNIKESSKKPLIQIIKTIRINYQIREILKQDFFYAAVGNKKSGKSTFIEQMLPGSDSAASSRINTTEIKPHKIFDSVTLFDFPHFESNDINHKLQFLFSRFLFDYSFCILAANVQTDSSDSTNLLEIVNMSFDHRFTVLLNHADQFWLNKKNNVDDYATKEELKSLRLQVCNKIASKVEDERVLLTCLNYGSITEFQIEKLKKTTEIYTINKLRKKVFEKIIEHIPKSFAKDDIKEGIKKKIGINEIREKIIKITKRGKKSNWRFHLITDTIQPCKDQNEHTDVRSLEELMSELNEQFDLKDPVIIDDENKKFETFEDLLISDSHIFLTFSLSS